MNALRRTFLAAPLAVLLVTACQRADAETSAAATPASSSAQADTPADAQADAQADAPPAGAAPADDQAATPLADAPLAEHRTALLELAFDAASRFPLDPHVKNRSRDQALVVDACLELDLPLRAGRYADGIENWRKGLAWARQALVVRADNGHEQAALDGLARAEEVLRWPDDVFGQSWRRDRIRARMAATHMLLGDDPAAKALVVNLDDSQVGALQTTRVQLAGEEAFEPTLEAMRVAFLAGTFDVVKAALDSCVLLYRRHYDDDARRGRIETSVVDNITKMPRSVGIDVTLRLAEVAAERDDEDNVLRLTDLARGLIDDGRWNPEDHVPLLARQAGLRFRGGQTARALDEAEAAWKLFDAERERIVDIYRADALVPLAEAYVRMRRPDRARELYALAVDEALVNPNSRPRTDDLTLICLSLARLGLDPGEALMARLGAARDGLGEPW